MELKEFEPRFKSAAAQVLSIRPHGGGIKEFKLKRQNLFQWSTGSNFRNIEYNLVRNQSHVWAAYQISDAAQTL